jgi:hypothetical protein
MNIKLHRYRQIKQLKNPNHNTKNSDSEQNQNTSWEKGLEKGDELTTMADIGICFLNTRTSRLTYFS